MKTIIIIIPLKTKKKILSTVDSSDTRNLFAHKKSDKNKKGIRQTKYNIIIVCRGVFNSTELLSRSPTNNLLKFPFVSFLQQLRAYSFFEK